ncbi:Dynein assembly factor 4, axonemal [Sparganum proliferum]
MNYSKSAKTSMNFPITNKKLEFLNNFSEIELVTFKPYLFECALEGSINVEKSSIVLANGLATCTLQKTSPGLWKRLETELKDDKAEMAKIRQDAIQEAQEREVQRVKQNRTEKRTGEKESLGAMMKIEGQELKRFEAIKKESTELAMQELVAIQEEKKKAEEEKRRQMDDAVKFAKELYGKNPQQIHQPKLAQEIFKAKENVPVRECNTISISFTPRVFPTPQRESMVAEEETWLANQAEHRRYLRQKVCDGGDLSEAEQDPLWLQKKANMLFKAGDFDAAAFAYSEAIKRAPKLPALYSNRAACYIKTRNFFKALEDSSAALDLLQPPVPQNLRARVRAHVRRAVAFCNLEMLKEGIQEYEAAAKLDPSDESIKQDLENLREAFLKPQKTIATK